jgi:hypothetical protein
MLQLGLGDFIKFDREAGDRVVSVAKEEDGEPCHNVSVFQNGFTLLWPAEWVILQVFAMARDVGERLGTRERRQMLTLGLLTEYAEG